MNEVIERSYYTRGSLPHKALDVISRKPMSTLEWRLEVTTKPMSFFQIHAIDVLLKDEYVTTRDKIFAITRKGEEYLDVLGRIKKQLPSSSKKLEHVGYDGAELKKPPAREEGLQFLLYPSRMNNKLRYRDGREETL